MHDASIPQGVVVPSDLSGPDVRLRRRPERGGHARGDVYAIVDEALICHVALAADGRVLSLPTAHARIGDQIFLHGAAKNRMLLALCESGEASLTFTLLDGLVLARTAFHHSMNYRSAVVFGRASEVVDGDEKKLALAAIVDHMAPGRTRELAQPTEAELKATRVVRVDIEQASAKTRQGGANDAPADLALPVWAGTVPLALIPGAAVPDAKLSPERSLSPAARACTEPRCEVPITGVWGEYEFSTERKRLDLPFVYSFLRDESYWARGLDEGSFHAALVSSLCFGAYHAGQQVAFARVITDGHRFSYVCDVFVRAELRGRGLGRAFVAFVLEHPRVKATARCLLGTRDAHSFYEPLGFVPAAPGRYMLRYRDERVPR